MRPMLASSSRMQLIGILQWEPGVLVGDGRVDVEQLVEQHRQDEVERLVGVGHDQEERRALLADHLELQLVLAEEVADRGDGERRQADVARRDDRGLGLRRSGGRLEALVLLDDEVLLGGLRGRLVAAVVGDDPFLEALEAVLGGRAEHDDVQRGLGLAGVVLAGELEQVEHLRERLVLRLVGVEVEEVPMSAMYSCLSALTKKSSFSASALPDVFSTSRLTICMIEVESWR